MDILNAVDYIVDRFTAVLGRLADIARNSEDCPGKHRDGGSVPAIEEKKPDLGARKLETRLIWSDEFNSDLSKWDQPTFVDSSRHRTGYKYLELDGTIDMEMGWQKVPGRWAALMHKFRDKVQFIRDGNLVLKPYAIEANNIYRENFYSSSRAGETQGRFQPYGDYQLFTPWLSPKVTYGPGTVIEVRSNREKQIIGGNRFSIFTMSRHGEHYTNSVAVAEIDHGETENAPGSDFGQRMLMKIVGGKAGDTKNSLIDLRKFGINLRKGWHTDTLVWNHDGTLDFLVDGVQVNRDDRSVTMDDAQLIIAMEANSGCKELEDDEIPESGQNYANGPRRPKDVGLTARSVIDGIKEILAGEHEVLVEWVRIHKIIGE